MINVLRFVPHHLYGHDSYPPYAAGFFYAVTLTYADSVLEYHRNSTSNDWLSIDDAYITGIVADELGCTKRLFDMYNKVGLFGVGEEVAEYWMSRADVNKNLTHLDAPVAMITESTVIDSGVWAKLSLLSLLSELRAMNIVV